MPQSLSNILVHLVFSTKGRRAFIGQELEDELWRYLAATCTAHDCQAHRVGGGHTSLDATEIYIEKDLKAAKDVAGRIG